MHALAACPPEAGDMSLTALGDFDPTPTTAEFVDSRLQGKAIGFPATTRAIQARLATSRGTWIGIAEENAPDGDFDVPLWPPGRSCDLAPAINGYPAGAGGQAIGLSGDGRVLLVAGGSTASADSARAIAVDLRTGIAAEVAGGMVPGRAFATATPFGDDLLVAGGLDPRTSQSGDPRDGRPLDSAIVYETASGRFDRAGLVPLSTARARHTALVLPSGETLLVGGVDESGLALATLDAISPVDRAPREIGLATLAVARIDPVALKLDDGRILVAGGVTSAGDAIDRLEYLSADASSATFKNVSVPARFDRAFVAMPGGAALAVGGCATRGGSDCRDAWWISSSGVPERLPDLPVEAPHPMLVRATDGAPWLVAGPDSARVLLRFDPWQGRFASPPAAPTDAPPADLPAPVALDGGAFVWLAHAAQGLALRGTRFDTRGRFAFDVAPLLSTLPPEGSYPETQALHVAPDRSPLRDGAGVAFDAATGLHLSGDVASAVVTDTTYATLNASITLTSGPPPLVLLDEHVFGAADCPWPAAEGDTLTVTLAPNTLVLSRGDVSTTCSIPNGRFALGFRAVPTAETVIRSVTIRRIRQ